MSARTIHSRWAAALLALAAVAARGQALPKGCTRSPIYQQARSAEGASADLDGDGLPDRLRVIELNGFVRLRFELQLSTLQKPISFEFSRSGNFIDATAVPAELLGPKLAPARAAVRDAMSEVSCDAPDPSLARLLNPSAPLQWLDGRPVMPIDYTLLSTDPAARRRLRNDLSDTPPPLPDAVWIFYSGHNQRRLDLHAGEFLLLSSARSSSELLATAHAVADYNPAANRHAWIYASAGGEKLRWPSIVEARLEVGNTAVISARRPPDEVVITATVDLGTGRTSERTCRVSDRGVDEASCKTSQR